jgi:hypothetical protein
VQPPAPGDFENLADVWEAPENNGTDTQITAPVVDKISGPVVDQIFPPTDSV